jgi:hypothetical protein
LAAAAAIFYLAKEHRAGNTRRTIDGAICGGERKTHDLGSDRGYRVAMIPMRRLNMRSEDEDVKAALRGRSLLGVADWAQGVAKSEC